MEADLARHECFMWQALALARRAWGNTHPNPMVGAIIVEDGAVAAEGWHARDGGPHAERVALAALGRAPKPGATLYVTLEPCSTHGRTGACCDAIIEAGIRRVVVGATDPNPDHAGAGYARLRAAGVEVITGVRERECADLNLIFNQWITTGLPLLAGKIATTLDGKIACRTGHSKWITGEAARADVHRWRRLFPAIAVGAMTVLADDPRLTARPADGGEWCPWRFVFDGLLRTLGGPRLPQVYTDGHRERTIVVTTPHGGMGYVRKLREMGVAVWVLDAPTQRVNFADFRRRCAEEKITGVYFEGGAQLLSELLRSRELDYLFNYRAPLLFADDKARSVFTGLRTESVQQAVRIQGATTEVHGEDSLVRGHVVYPSKLSVDETAFGIG
ncbi:bifunctional diaminohydroxyphosphoribosylaminopyrimidine deaminase/5-amino-6-(5-phosphoribosylamino)uracil reductase RibD [Opitutaceae bacterium TAV4]|nr:bifunctional diaminohydroxyphosphoribosylaminopyrimidine deaminase/5-amino-6-(5-phosphoribosylamino)uracil reductase RibD [Opitutaceae bacterium TAV4]RRJ98547.1 bifunctional diaminohydroxyphosphoribosylaminopyrimidine deaminase/5-amino-6-(5-phosphoribosylamino)uracil reductase RibD [Opitutaceae bacterium TAV3]